MPRGENTEIKSQSGLNQKQEDHEELKLMREQDFGNKIIKKGK